MSPTPTSTATYSDDADAEKDLAQQLTLNGPLLQFTPEQNPASTENPPRPPLEIITMPQWLWVATPAMQTKVASTGDVVVDQVVIDLAFWSFNGAAAASCLGAAPPQGIGLPYDPAYGDPASPNVPSPYPSAPQPCIVQNPSTPLYTTSIVSGTTATTAGVVNVMAKVNWHVAYTVTNGGTLVDQGTVPGTVLTAVKAPANGQPAVQFRIGEIQALVTQH